jgi:hypothetical protein
MRRGGTVLTAGSVVYNQVSSTLSQLVREEVMAEQQRRANAQAMPIPYAGNPDQMARLQRHYPEFTFIPVPLFSGVHVGLEAERMAATSLCLHRVAQYTPTMVALGNAMLPAAFLRLRGAHLEMSPNNAYAVHANHTAQSLYVKMARQTSVIQRDHGYTLDASVFKDFLHGRILQVSDNPHSGVVNAGGLFADLSMYPMSVAQYCTAMATAGARVGEVMIPYTPDMLVHASGEWDDTGAAYEITRKDLLLKYPEGVTGTTRFPLGAWIEWLRSGGASVSCGGEDFHYEVELSGLRGPFLFASVVRVETEAPKSALAYRTHALELPQQGKRYFVRSYRLKSLAYNPSKRSSYEMICYTPDARIVDKVFAHAMSLPKESFKDSAIFKRVTVLDGRITFAGMSVTVERPVAMEEVAQLTQDVVLRAFIARYNMGELGADLMGQLNSVRGFAAASTPMKFAYLTIAVLKCAWDWTLGALIDALRTVVVMGLGFLRKRNKLDVPEFSPAPTFVQFDTYTSWLTRRVYSKVAPGTGGNLLVPYIRGAAEVYKATNRYIPSTPPTVPVPEIPDVVVSPRGLGDEIIDTREAAPVSERAAMLVDALVELNGIAESPGTRFDLPINVVQDVGEFDTGPVDYVTIADYTTVLGAEHNNLFPGVGLQEYEADNSSLMFDKQEWNIEANYMRMPLVGDKPSQMTEVYKSRCKTYRVERKMQSKEQLLQALNERNLGVPSVSGVNNVGGIVVDTWENFLDVCCKPEAREMIAEWKRDRVTFERECFEEWTKKANGKKIETMLAELQTAAKALEEYDVSDFDVMIKSDAKPPMSTKPTKQQLPPQVIVYHRAVLSAAYSSIFRVLSTRFLALLHPKWLVSLRKDVGDVRKHFTRYYPWDSDVAPVFLENDYSKYDKSQSEVCVRLEEYVNRELGFDEELLQRWYAGHETSTIHSVQHALTLEIDWQRRSGGSNTSFGNVTINILTTAFVYRSSDVIAAAYIGDDSVLMCRKVGADAQSVAMLAEMYNLLAKFVITDFPYFASSFILFDKEQRQALSVPDPYKRAERVGLSVNARNPNWPDRLRSHIENCEYYKYRKVQKMLIPAMVARYELSRECDPAALLNALATSAESEESARNCWEAEPTQVYVY